MLSRLLMAFALVLASTAQAGSSFVVASFHDVREDVRLDYTGGSTVVTPTHLEAYFQWLKDNGYHVVGIQDLLDAKAGKQAGLPDKAVVLTFDDGYASFYHTVFPLLKRYGYPATVALVGSWMDLPDGAVVPLGGEFVLKRESLLSWEQVRELARSGLVEIASHSYDMHRGLPGNPQGNLQPAGVTRIYDPASKSYESDEAYRKRIREDLQSSADGIARHAGVKPRVMVWPYGEYNQALLEEAARLGMVVTMGLREGRNDTSELAAVKRMLLTADPEVDEFADILTRLRADRPVRVAHVDLDYIYDPDPAQTERNLGEELERIHAMGVNAVYLQAYADPDGDGNADALYFPNRHLPMRADLFNRAAWQFHIRARVRVYAWMPVLAYRAKVPEDWFVREWRDGKARTSSHIYHRLSPFNAKARKLVGEIYEDLAKHCNFNGLLFHDDAILSDFEDVSPVALTYGKKVWGLPDRFEHLHEPAGMRMRWAQRKTAVLHDFTDELASRVRAFRPELKTARNLYALPVLMPDSEEWYAQNFAEALKHYDYIALEAMPFMEKAERPDAWLKSLVEKVAAYPDGLKKTVFELQSVDWNTQQDIPMEVFLGQADLLLKAGAVHLGYYPDNPFHDQPRLASAKSVFTAPWAP